MSALKTFVAIIKFDVELFENLLYVDLRSSIDI